MAGLLGGKRICASVALPGDGLKSVCAGKGDHIGGRVAGVRLVYGGSAPDMRPMCAWRVVGIGGCSTGGRFFAPRLWNTREADFA